MLCVTRRLLSRRAISVSPLQMSFVQELSELRKTQGKPFRAQMLKEGETFMFPEMKSLLLDGSEVTLPSFFENRVTLVAFSMRQVGAEKLKSWTSPLAERACSSSKSRRHTKIIQVSLVENFIASMFKSYYLKNLRRLEETDPLLHHTTLLRLGDSTKHRDVLGMRNRLVGYVFLVDHRGMVRFRASGEAEKDELDLLFDQTVRLVRDKESEPSRSTEAPK